MEESNGLRVPVNEKSAGLPADPSPPRRRRPLMHRIAAAALLAVAAGLWYGPVLHHLIEKHHAPCGHAPTVEERAKSILEENPLIGSPCPVAVYASC
ncbi:hypothetical protein BS50DRAFT_555931 [Corynespora cassiicola Philippines]|uniref:Uncharacterized protein n=1 Tax=Corynespora cassiicola Philippines TaxID=1448308 RepID=A0A2T2NIU9_CORCC|nr:hypothetical protein BS50DRAFT_555931 [Corynespora cassiicola Philippines]